ncbi:MAG: biopolymer transporter ExbD [Pseudomonadota bacterium]
MKLTRPLPRQRPETLIALIDVVFFLLAFFMLIGRLDATAPFEVTPPLAVSGADLPGGGLTISIAPDGALALDGVALGRDDLLGRVEGTLAARPETLVRVNGDGVTAVRHVLPVVSALEAMDARDVVIVVSPNPQ